MKKIIIPILFILLAAISRFLPHPANFAPIAGMALFGGVYFSKKFTFIVPFLALLISDFFIGFHQTMPFVYGSFLIIGLIGLWLKNHKTTKNIFASTLVSSILFFIITNFGVWFMGNMYAKSIFGLADCYVMAIPFFRNTIVGDLFYTGVFFGGYQLLQLDYKRLFQFANFKRLGF